MKEFLKLNWAFLLAILVSSTMLGGMLIERSVRKEAAGKHIELAIATGKMCSSCHFGASFVNLFNNKAVIRNDNVVFYILDEVKVKRW